MKPSEQLQQEKCNTAIQNRLHVRHGYLLPRSTWFERAHSFSPQKPSEAFLISKVSRLPIIMCVPGTTKLPREGKRTSQEGFTLSYAFLAVSCRNQVRLPQGPWVWSFSAWRLNYLSRTDTAPLKKNSHDAPCCPSDDHIHCIPLSGEQGERQAKKRPLPLL